MTSYKSRARAAADLSLGWSYTMTFSDELGDFKADLGIERDTSPSIGNNIYSLISLDYYL